MSVSVKCQYALRALFELAKRRGQGLVRLSQVAEAQDIPGRFLENILNQLRQGGFVESRRGLGGGFKLLKEPVEISIHDVVSFIDGPVYPIECDGPKPARVCALKGSCVFSGLWSEARAALTGVYQNTTLDDLLARERGRACNDYVI